MLLPKESNFLYGFKEREETTPHYLACELLLCNYIYVQCDQYDPRKVIYGMVIHEYAKYKNNTQCLQLLVENNQTYETDISKAEIKGAT